MAYSPRLAAAGTTRLHRLVVSVKPRHSAAGDGVPAVNRIDRVRAYAVEHSSLHTPLILPHEDVVSKNDRNKQVNGLSTHLPFSRREGKHDRISPSRGGR